MLNGRSTRDEKFDYLNETDAEEKNVGSVIPFEQDAMGIRNDEGKVGGDANTPVFGEDDDADDEDYDEVDEDEETDLKNIGIGIPGNLEHAFRGDDDTSGQLTDVEDFAVEDEIALDEEDLEEIDEDDLDEDDLDEDDLEDEDIDDENAGTGATFNAGYTTTVHDAGSAR